MKEEQIIKLLEKAKTAISRLLFSYNRHWIKMSLDKCSGTSPSEIAGSIVNAEETAEAIKIALLEADKPETEPCTMCEGSRKIEENPESIKGYTMITCPRCKGTGKEPASGEGEWRKEFQYLLDRKILSGDELAYLFGQIKSIINREIAQLQTKIERLEGIIVRFKAGCKITNNKSTTDCEMITQLQTQVQELEEKLKTAVCIWCQKELPRDMEDKEKQAEILVDHLFECPNHPIVKLRAKIDKLEEKNKFSTQAILEYRNKITELKAAVAAYKYANFHNYCDTGEYQGLRADEIIGRICNIITLPKKKAGEQDG